MFHHAETLFLVQCILLVGLPYFIWRIRIVRKFTPLVVAQILIGIILGPSVLGLISPEIFTTLFPSKSLDMIGGLSWIAIIFFGFLTGNHFDVKDIKGRGRVFATTSISSIAVPFLLSLATGYFVLKSFPDFAGAKATDLAFVLAMGIAGGVTALPVLSATMIDMGMIHSPIGRKALGCATVNDGLLWILVSILLMLTANGSVSSADIAKTLGLTSLYFVTMFFLVRPMLQHFYKKGTLTEHPHNGQIVGISCLLFASALATDLIGLHYLLGAFVCGTIIPKGMTNSLHHKIDPTISVVLLPFFFMSTGIKTQFDMDSLSVWLVFGLMSVVSSVGKVAGTAIPARSGGYSMTESLMLGGLMQCKGLMEVVVLTMMLNAEIISRDCFSAIMLMAVATTAFTKPFVLAVARHGRRQHASLPHNTSTEAVRKIA